jgi:hypothetical protein
VGALEREEWLRAAWKVMVAGALDARSVVFVDEMGTHTSLSPKYGSAKKGQGLSACCLAIAAITPPCFGA